MEYMYKMEPLLLILFSLVAFSSLAEESQSAQYKQAQKLLEENLEHQKEAEANGGIVTSCRTYSETSKEVYETHEQYQKTFYDQNLDKIKKRTQELAEDGSFLTNAEKLYQTSSGDLSLDSSSWFQQAREKEQEIDEIKEQIQLKKLEYDSLEKKCDLYCKSSESYRLKSLKTEIQQLEVKLTQSEKEFKKLAKENKQSAQNASNQLSNAKSDIDQNDALMAQSHSISGCNSQTGHSTNSDCILSGPLVEKDQELTDLMNSSIDNIKALTESRQKRLLELELEKQYNGEYELFEIALADLDDNKTNSELARSNLEVMAMASAAIKDLDCHPHPLSDADSKSYHLFRAASATYLASQINDTSYYNDSVSCRAKEDYTNDKNDLQYRTVERAANVVNGKFENLCLRITPENGDLKNECQQYLDQIRGAEYKDKPKTREQALLMYQAALEAALEEQNAKREKIAIAQANVEKGKKWVDTATNRIKMAIIIKVGHYLLSGVYSRISEACAASQNWACASYNRIKSFSETTAAKIIEGLIAAYYVTDLIRAKKFLSKWETKLKRAYHFTHLACNFREAKKEQSTLIATGKEAKRKTQEELDKKKRDVLNDIDQTIYNQVKQSKKQTSFFNIKSLPFIQSVWATSEVLEGQGSSLALAPGSTSFEYFLTQRSFEWMSQSNDITTSDNFKGTPYLSAQELGKDLEAFEKIPLEDRVGFPVPETRVFLLQTTVTNLMSNISKLQMAIYDVYQQRELYLDHLKDMGEKLQLGVQGLGDIDPNLSGSTISSVCLVTSNGSQIVDQTCECKKTNTCLSIDSKGELNDFEKGSLDQANTVIQGGEPTNAFYQKFKSNPLKAKSLSEDELKKIYNSRFSRAGAILDQLNLSDQKVDLSQKANTTILRSDKLMASKKSLTQKKGPKTSSKSGDKSDDFTLEFAYHENESLSKEELDELGLSHSREKGVKQLNNKENSSLENQISHDRETSIFEKVSNRYEKQFKDGF